MRKFGRLLAAFVLAFIFTTHSVAAQGFPVTHKIKVIALATALAASGSTTFELDMHSMARVNVFLRQTYAAGTSSTTGVTVTQTYAAVDPAQAGEVFVYAGNSTSISTIITPTPSQGSSQSTISEWNVGVGVLPRKLKLTVTNADSSKAASLDVWIDYN